MPVRRCNILSGLSTETIQHTQGEVRRGGFGDFMFGSTNHGQESSSSEITSRAHNSLPLPAGTETNSIGEHQKEYRDSRWQNYTNGNIQTKIHWIDGNMWELRISRRPD